MGLGQEWGPCVLWRVVGRTEHGRSLWNWKAEKARQGGAGGCGCGRKQRSSGSVPVFHGAGGEASTEGEG